ncbi:MAG: hypothetical protein ACK587_08025 [Cyanobacteriota bacterium]
MAPFRAGALRLLVGPPPAEERPRDREGLAGGLRGEEERTGRNTGWPRF